MKGVEVRLIDTAGTRRPEDPIEKEGIDRVKRRIYQGRYHSLSDRCLRGVDAGKRGRL